jgi:hypothetical protein
MMKLPDYNKFIAWAQEKPEVRSVKIETESFYAKEVNVWVYDYSLEVGQHVTSVEEIDLENEFKHKELAEYERLKAKYEKKSGEDVGTNA